MTRSYRLERVQLVRRPRDEVLAFFADVRNLEAITPAFLKFKILTPLPLAMRAGALIDYRLQLFGVPFRWRATIETWEPPQRFSDVQLKGPYRRWHHVHEFYEVPEGTLCVDVVDYQLPLGPLGALARALFVRRQLEAIFDYRRAVIEKLLPAAVPSAQTA